MDILNNNIEKVENATIRKGAAILKTISKDFKDGKAEIPIDTGFSDISKIYKGFKRNQIVILGGRSSMGKTTVALNIVYNLLKRDKKVLFVDLEEQQEENLIRLATIHMQFKFKDYLENPNLCESQKKEAETKLQKAVEWLESREFYYINKPNLKLDDIKEIAKTHKNLDLLVIDHLTKIKSNAFGNRYEKVTDIACNLRELSADLGGVPLLIPAQINREAIKGQSIVKPPTIADLKGSGEIEENADVVILLHRDSYYNQELEAPKYMQATEEPFTFVIGKNRGSKTGMAILKWIAELNTVSEYKSYEKVHKSTQKTLNNSTKEENK